MDVKIEKAHTHWKKNCCTIQAMGQDREVNLSSEEFLSKEIDESMREASLSSLIVSFCTVQLYDDFGNTFSSCRNENNHRQFLN
jgi:hypothetical protein